MDLSIIIINYNTKNITLDCLESVKKSLKYDPLIKYEIILYDNASHDGSKAFFQNYPGINYIYSKENIGFGRGNNEAVKNARGKTILLLNSDIVVLEDAIPKMFKYYEKNFSKREFLGAKLLNKDKSPQPSAAPFYTLPVVFGALFLGGDYWGLTRYSPNNNIAVDWVAGACIMTKKEFYNQIGGFDQDIFLYMEEVDLLLRAKEKKLYTAFFSEAKFIHLGSASSQKRTQPILQVYRGFIYLYNKHYSALAKNILKIMLELKAIIAFIIGKVTNNKYLIETYGEAYKIAKNA